MPGDGGETTLVKAAASDPAAPAHSWSSDKDELIRSMARALRVAFKMASMYNPDHPAFKSSVNELMVKLEAIFVHISPLSIGFSPHALLIDNRFWEGERTYVDLAQLFHFRKIKRLEIRPGIPHAEFMRFASKIMLPVKAFIKEGGAQAIIKKENILHISLDVLDYSQVLLGEGEEIKDIWPYLLMEAVEENDDDKLDQLAGSFEKVVGKFNTEDLIQNEELHKNFAKFFQFMGVWPVGTLVSLSDGRVGVVRAVNEQEIERPSVQVLAPENAGEVVDLSKLEDVRILESLNPQGEGAKYLPLIGCPPPPGADDEEAEASNDD